jgi:hypothetical protein
MDDYKEVVNYSSKDLGRIPKGSVDIGALAWQIGQLDNDLTA